MKATAVAFDLLGTVVPGYRRRAYDAMLHSVATALGVDAHAFVDAWNACYEARVTGAIGDTRSTLLAICTGMGSQPTSQQLQEAWARRVSFTRSALVARAGMIEVLQRLKTLDVPTAIISDCSQDIPSVWNDTLLSRYFRTCVFSCEVGCRKPARRVYEIAAERLRTPLHQFIFVGDGGNQELSGAATAGMHPIRLSIASDGDVHKVGDDEIVVEEVSSVRALIAIVLGALGMAVR